MSQIIRKGVKSVSKSGSSELTGDITLSEGTGVTLTQSGQDIEIAASGGGSGDVTGPASATDNAIARFDSTTGKLIQDAPYSTIDDTGKLRLTNAYGTLFTIDDGQVTASGGTDLGLASVNGVRIDATGSSSGVQISNDDLKTNAIAERSAGSGVTIDGLLIKDGEVDGVDVSTTYRTGGTDVALADGGTGASLTDPNADRIMFWDDSAGAVTWLTPSTGLTLSGTNLTARTSSTTQTGIIETATTTEATTGTDTSRAVTAAGVQTFWNDRFVDEDDMVSNSATKAPSQQSVKAYVDANAGGVSGPVSSTDNGIARFDGTGGDTIQNVSQITIADNGYMLSSASIETTGAFIASTIELGNTTDTTLTRASAGVLAVEGVNVPTVSSTDTLSNKTLTSPVINGGTGTSLAMSSSITSSGGAIGYASGAGGTVTQTTSKSTGVTINKLSGEITTHNETLTANGSANFMVTNSFVSASDVVIVNQVGGTGVAAGYNINVYNTANGSFDISLRNVTTVSLSHNLVLRFAVIKAATA